MKRLRVLFVIDKIGFLEILSIPTLSAAIKREGHQVELVEFSRNEARALRQVESYEPDVVAYSMCSNEIDRYMDINARIKNRASCFSVFGGPHPTFFPELIKRNHVDAICRGEGDRAFPGLLERLGSDSMWETPNFLFKLSDGGVRENPPGDLIGDLDELPFPDRDLVYSKNQFLAASPIKSFFAGRGCPFKCTYCFNHAYHELYKGKGHVVRTKSVPYVINEIRSVAEKYTLGFVKFQDDVFGVKKSWLEEFAETYPREIGLPFLCYARPNMVTEDYARYLKKAGCYSVCMAIESGNETIRRDVLHRRMTDERIIQASSCLKNQGIRLYMVNMVGLPMETEEDMIRTVELNRRAGADFADASIFQPYPGTHITNRCKEMGLLDDGKETFESQFTTSVLNFEPQFKAKIQTIHRLFSIMVDHEWVQTVYPTLSKIALFKPFLNVLYRFYYGINLHDRIYAGKIPLSLRLKGSLSLLFSKNRT